MKVAKNIRKAIVVLLCASMVMTNVLPSFAEGNVESEPVLEEVATEGFYDTEEQVTEEVGEGISTDDEEEPLNNEDDEEAENVEEVEEIVEDSEEEPEENSEDEFAEDDSEEAEGDFEEVEKDSEEVEDNFEEIEEMEEIDEEDIASPSEITDEENEEENDSIPADMVEEPEEDEPEDVEELALLGSTASPSDAEDIEDVEEPALLGSTASPSDAEEVEESTSDELLYEDNNIKFSSGMETEIPFDPKTWMSKLPNNYPITELTVPASHDSGTYNIKFYGLELLKMEIYKMINDQLGVSIGEDVYNFLRENFSLMTKLLEKMATWAIDTIQQCSGQCQTDSITEQLNKGIRALDLRFRYEDGEFYIVHGCESEGLIGILTTCNCYDKNNNRLTLDMCFSEIRDFLNEHKKEVVFISVQQEGGDYNREIEKKIIQLEFNYGIEFHFSKRKYSESVINELYPTTPNNKNINAKASSTMDRGIHVLGQFRQKAVDITDAVEDWENHWSDTVDMKKNHLKDAVKDHSLLGMAQSNVMVKIYKKNDPHKECSFPFSIKLVRIPVIRIPLYITIDFHAEKLIITPKAQAAKVKPHLMNLIKNYTNSGKSSDKALGLVRLDFPSASECAIIANVNTKNTYFPETGELDTSDYSFVYDGLADYETEAEEFLEEAEREVEEFSVYDYRFYIDNNNSGGGGSSGSSGGTPRYDLNGNILGPSGKQSYTYDGTNPPNLTGNINVSSWNYEANTSQSNNIKYAQNIDSFVRADNTPVVTEWVGVTTNDIGKVMWYRTDATGKILKNQFIQIGTNIYYLDNNGIMATGQHNINGKVYNFDTTIGATEGRLLY